jgi:hypothetical protein
MAKFAEGPERELRQNGVLRIRASLAWMIHPKFIAARYFRLAGDATN